MLALVYAFLTRISVDTLQYVALVVAVDLFLWAWCTLTMNKKDQEENDKYDKS